MTRSPLRAFRSPLLPVSFATAVFWLAPVASADEGFAGLEGDSGVGDPSETDGEDLALPEDSTDPAPIIHGEDAEISDYPMTGGLIASGGVGVMEADLLMCSSTLIAPDVVLAAAHCVDLEQMAEEYGITLDWLEFRFSRKTNLSMYALGSNADLPDDAVLARDWVKHPDFDIQELDVGLAENYDISLLFLEEPLWDVPYAYLPTAEEASQVVDGAEVVVVGWGQQTADQQPPAGTVGYKQMGVSTIEGITEYEFRVGLVEADVRKCHGDSGGPSFLDVETEIYSDPMRIVGVTSHAYDMTDCAVTGGVDTRVDHYLSWIDAEMRSRCEDGSRAWCLRPGILPPPGIDGGSGDDEERGGCGCASTPRTGLGLLPLLAVGLAARRRPRSLEHRSR